MNSRYHCIGAGGAGGCLFRFRSGAFPGVSRTRPALASVPGHQPGVLPGRTVWCGPARPSSLVPYVLRRAPSVPSVGLSDFGSGARGSCHVCGFVIIVCIGTSSFSSSGLVLSVRWSDLLSFYSFVHVNTLSRVCACVCAHTRACVQCFR